VSEYILPFAQHSASSVIKRREVLATGKGFADDYNARPWKDTINRLRPSR